MNEGADAAKWRRQFVATGLLFEVPLQDAPQRARSGVVHGPGHLLRGHVPACQAAQGIQSKDAPAIGGTADLMVGEALLLRRLGAAQRRARCDRCRRPGHVPEPNLRTFAGDRDQPTLVGGDRRQIPDGAGQTLNAAYFERNGASRR